MLRALTAALVALVLPASAAAGDRALLRAKERYLPAAARSYPATPDGLQARYDAGRDLVEGVRAALPGSTCARLAGQLRALARAQVRWAEAYDHPVRSSPPRRLPRVTASCSPRPPRVSTAGVRPSWPEPPRWQASVAPLRRDAALAARLHASTKAFSGWAGVWLHELGTGRYAGVNPRLLLPAASTVKLGVLAAWLRSAGRPERSPLAYDAAQVGSWSSNLAANRIVAHVGLAAVYEGMRRLGIASSTYPGLYRAGSVRSVGPPGGHTRVTTARDLGTALFRLHAAANGRRWALRALGVTRRQASVGLSLLRDPLRAGDNLGLLRPWLPRSTSVVEKNGWISDTRVTAAIVYGERGPVVVVVAAFRDGIGRREARALGRRVLRAARVDR